MCDHDGRATGAMRETEKCLEMRIVCEGCGAELKHLGDLHYEPRPCWGTPEELRGDNHHT